MKATDLLQLVNEREEDSMGKVPYKSDHTPDNHVKNKRMKEVNPLPSRGEKNDKRPKANVGDVRAKERRSMEGPKTGVKKMAEQAPSTAGIQVQERPFSQRQAQVAKLLGLSKPQKVGGNYRLMMTDTRQRPHTQKTMDVTPQQLMQMIDYVKSAPDDSAVAFYQSTISKAGEGSSVGGTMGRRTAGRSVGAPMSQQQIAKAGSGWQLEDDVGGIDVVELEPEEIQAMPAGMDVRHYEPNDIEQVTMRGGAAPRPARVGKKTVGITRARESVDNSDSMKKNVPVQKGPKFFKSTSVRSGQDDEPEPTADVGKPKNKEKRSMDANPVTVKDFKGGENEHKKLGVHEGISELERLLHRKIDTTFLENSKRSEPHKVSKGGGKDDEEYWEKRKNLKKSKGKDDDVDEAMQLPPTKVDPKRATGGIRAAARGADLKRARKKRAQQLKARSTRPEGEAPEGSFWKKVEKHM